MIWVLLALGLVAVVEGLVLALAPSHLERVLATLATLSHDKRRFMGLTAMAFGVGLIALARWIGF